ncbi:MAG TPA: sigma-70 family RNA polymerase sigma factor [Pseudobacteroides sp.]|uniref:sigma-70 family RNA polymerase sigma factor n=1 Tax=Pseudobacteroides sp. TaxID=1968840 RepID=UPI002F9368EE
MLFISVILNYTGETATRIVEKIKNGDKHLKEKFIEDYIPFIIKVISSFYSSRIVDVKNSDEYSIGLMAFDEAIEKFDSGKSKGFLNFAQMVIRRRIIDYFRNISSISKNEIPFSYFNSKSESDLEEKLNMFDIGMEAGRYELIYELNDFSRQLESYGLNIRNLPEYIPKHKDSKQMCIHIAKKVIENKNIYNKLKTKKYFQMKELIKVIDVHPKTVERNREFIICLCIILESDYVNFKSYLNQVF